MSFFYINKISNSLDVVGTITGDTSLTLDTTTITTAEIGVLDSVTPGTAAVSKALVLNSDKDIGTIRNLTIDGTFSDGNYTFDTSGNVTGLGTVGCGAITSSGNLAVTGTITGDTSLTLDSTTITTAEIGVLDSATPGTAVASKALIVDSNLDIADIRNISMTGTITATGLGSHIEAININTENTDNGFIIVDNNVFKKMKGSEVVHEIGAVALTTENYFEELNKFDKLTFGTLVKYYEPSENATDTSLSEASHLKSTFHVINDSTADDVAQTVNIPNGSEGKIVHIFYTHNTTSTGCTTILDFTANNLYSGSGTSRFLTFNTTGQSATVIYLIGSGAAAGSIGAAWRIINTGATVSS